MDTAYPGQPEIPALLIPARTAYRAVRGMFRKVRAIGNLFLNLSDKPIIILLYHQVATLPCDPEMLAVSPENFRQQVKFLKQHVRIARFADDWTHLDKPAVVITFDDGYADNAKNALPILEEFDVPATFFISTGHIGTTKEFWWDRLETILLREGEFPEDFRLDDIRHARKWASGTFRHRQAMYNSLNALMLRVTPERRETWLEQLKHWAGAEQADQTGNNIHRSMSHGELKKLAASPCVTIGAHTVTHSALAALSEEQQRKEIFTSKQDLEEMTGTEITTFSYPFGRKRDYNRISLRLCREAGFVKAAANFPGQVHRWSDPYQLPRHLVRNWDLETFTAQLKSFWTR